MDGPGDVVADERIPQYLVGFGLALVLVVAGEAAVFASTSVRDVREGSFVVGSLTTLPAAAGLVAGGWWLGRSDVSPARYRRVAGWCVAGLLAFFGMNVALVVAMPPGGWAEAFSWLRWSVALGASTGLFVGLVEARAVEQAVATERAVVRSEHLAEQRDMLDYLNSVLRHEILNAATAIEGYATRLLEDEPDLDDEQRRWLDIVVDETDDMARVIDDVRVLLRRTTGDHELRRVDLADVLRDELQALENRWDDVAIDASVPEDAAVRADETLPRVFGHLLSNAVEHNDAETPHVRVDVERRHDVVRVDVADDGPGIPDDEVDSLFERGCCRGESHGLGLYLVDELVTSYGGAVELVETGPDGTRFRVELPRALGAEADDAAAAAA